MSNFLYEIPTKIIGTVDTQGNSSYAKQRQKMVFSGATIQDDASNEQTIVSIDSSVTATLSEVLTNDNSAGNQRIINLSNPLYSMDAANKSYVDSTITSSIDSTLFGTKVTGTITSGTAYQTIATITPNLTSWNAKTIVIKLFTSKKYKNQEVRYTILNNSSALVLANEATTNDLSSSDTTNYTNGHSVKLIVSGTDVLVQVLQESGLTTTYTLYYSLWTI